MLRAFGEFFLVFWLLGLVVHLDSLIHIFGVVGFSLLATDLLLARSADARRTARAHRQPPLWRL
jgi:hypothetical protein